MRALIGLGFLLAATAADAQTYTTTINRDAKSVTTSGAGYSATTTQSGSNTYTTTVTRNSGGGFQPMGAGGYHPMGH